MWEKFKESNFAKKCRELSHKGGFVATIVCLTLVVAVVLSVSIATNRAKQKYAGEVNEDSTVSRVENDETEKTPVNKPNDNENDKENDKVNDKENNKEDDKTQEDDKTNGKEDQTVGGTVDVPVHKDETETPVGGEPEEFKLSLPVTGVIAKGHDATIQVWSETLGAYKVHLGLDIATEEGTPVLAAADGKVAKVWDDALMGRCVAIDHGDDIFTFYKNLDPILSAGIAEGKELKRGEQIGKIGESAISELADEPHLHIEMTVNGLAVDPTDYFSDEAKDTIANVGESGGEAADK